MPILNILVWSIINSVISLCRKQVNFYFSCLCSLPIEIPSARC
ncbi:unnamed protein product [Tenebrio molitor]|nr:unnamed protein product [Tenebrio molitor]